jgi:hypothetical protein
LRRQFDEYNAEHRDRTITPEIHGPEAGAKIDTYRSDVRGGRLSGCLVISAGAAAGEKCQFYMRSDKITSMECLEVAGKALNSIVMARRMAENNVAPALFDKIG